MSQILPHPSLAVMALFPMATGDGAPGTGLKSNPPFIPKYQILFCCAAEESEMSSAINNMSLFLFMVKITVWLSDYRHFDLKNAAFSLN
jgi:hypothetical protein